MEIKIDWSIKAVLATIALGLLINGLNPWIKPGDAYAGGSDAGWALPMHFEVLAGGDLVNRKNGQVYRYSNGMGGVRGKVEEVGIIHF